MKKFNVMHTLQVVVEHDFEAHDENTYLEGIGAVEIIDYSSPLTVQLPNGKVIHLHIHDLEVLETTVEENEEG